ncbi:hypothetical protein [Nocardioides sp.]|uniref:hypothetical protein n=1 Tax=Nocardioides sp. TaxID=35761 RepID=UPI00378468F0
MAQRETTAKKATAKKASQPKPRPAPNLTAAVGTTVELEVDEDAREVAVELPDGTKRTVYAAGGRALYVLDRPGIHIAGGLVVAATP